MLNAQWVSLTNAHACGNAWHHNKNHSTSRGDSTLQRRELSHKDNSISHNEPFDARPEGAPRTFRLDQMAMWKAPLHTWRAPDAPNPPEGTAFGHLLIAETCITLSFPMPPAPRGPRVRATPSTTETRPSWTSGEV